MPSTTVSKLTAEQQLDVLWKALCARNFWVGTSEWEIALEPEHKFGFEAYKNVDGRIGDEDVADIFAPTREELIEK